MHEKFHYQSPADLQRSAQNLGIILPWSDQLEPLFQPVEIGGRMVPNRMAVQPMEGFDSGADGTPGDLTFRRYGRYAAGGSGLIWFEACSVVPDGRSNPHQMMITGQNVGQFRNLTEHIRKVAADRFGSGHRPFLVLQLTHSGRYSHPGADFRPRVFSNNPLLESAQASQQPGGSFYQDAELDAIRDSFIGAVELADRAGFDAVDIKACHGYLLHEMLFAYDRTDSRYGGSFANRTRFLSEVLHARPEMTKAVRLSAFDLIPYPHGFGMKTDGSTNLDLSEVKRLVEEFQYTVPLWNISAGIPRYNAFVGRPFDRAVYNGPVPDEHPLTGIERLIRVTGELQQSFPDLLFTGSAFSWLRQYFPQVGAGIIKEGKASFIGLGRSSFAYPDAPADLLEKGMLDPKKVCVCCSKCTEFMRQGVNTGCAVRDGEYKGRGQRAEGKRKELRSK